MNAFQKKPRNFFTVIGAYANDQKEMLISREIAASPSVWALIAAHLFALFGIVVLRWDIFTAVILFWAETIIVYLLAIIKMAVCALYRRRENEHKPHNAIGVMILYFLSYSAVSLVVLAGIAPKNITSPFIPERNFLPLSIVALALRQSAIGILAFAGSHILSFFANFIRRREYARAKLAKMIALPHTRSGAGIVALLIGASVAYTLHSTIPLLPAIIVKLLLDASAHIHEHALSQSSS